MKTKDKIFYYYFASFYFSRNASSKKMNSCSTKRAAISEKGEIR